MSVNLKALLDRLGIADEVTKKTAYALTGEEAIQKVVKGEADIVLAFVSEILPVKGATWLGPLPAAVQVPTSYSAAIGAGSANPNWRACCLPRSRARKEAASSRTPASSPSRTKGPANDECAAPRRPIAAQGCIRQQRFGGWIEGCHALPALLYTDDFER